MVRFRSSESIIAARTPAGCCLFLPGQRFSFVSRLVSGIILPDRFSTAFPFSRPDLARSIPRGNYVALGEFAWNVFLSPRPRSLCVFASTNPRGYFRSTETAKFPRGSLSVTLRHPSVAFDRTQRSQFSVVSFRFISSIRSPLHRRSKEGLLLPVEKGRGPEPFGKRAAA